MQSNLHGVIDHKNTDDYLESEDNDIPDVPIGYNSEYQIFGNGKVKGIFEDASVKQHNDNWLVKAKNRKTQQKDGEKQAELTKKMSFEKE